MSGPVSEGKGPRTRRGSEWAVPEKLRLPWFTVPLCILCLTVGSQPPEGCRRGCRIVRKTKKASQSQLTYCIVGFIWSWKRDSKTACRFKPNTEIPIKSGS